MIQLNERLVAIDFVTIKEALASAGDLDEVGGAAYIASLCDGVPHSTNVEYYARIVKEKATLRNLIYAANRILTNAYGADQEPDVILDDAERAVFAVADGRIRDGFLSMDRIVQDNYWKIETLSEQKRLITGVATGFLDLDEMTRGLQPAYLIIVAARPSMGKTSLALNIAEHASRQGAQQGTQQGAVGVFSLEMSTEALFLRMLCGVAQIDSHRLMSGLLGKRDYERISGSPASISPTGAS